MWIFEEGDIPIFATAIHNGHFVHKDILNFMAISEHDRLKEEDPYTAEFTTIFDCRLVNYLSRFEVDFNRPKSLAVYKTPKEAWGLNLWKSFPPESIINRSLDYYDKFYFQLREFIDRLLEKFEKIVVYDIHSYNYRRTGIEEPQEYNPDINVGTGTMLKPEIFRTVIDAFISSIKGKDFFGRPFDVRENVKFKGGYFPKWLHTNYPENICVLSIEIKKIFMDENTGEIYPEKILRLKHMLAETIVPVIEALEKL